MATKEVIKAWGKKAAKKEKKRLIAQMQKDIGLEAETVRDLKTDSDATLVGSIKTSTETPEIFEKKVEDKKVEDTKVEDKKVEDKNVENKKIEDKKVEDKKIEDKRVEDKNVEDKN